VPLVVFDIGSTLVRASSGRIASRIAAELDLAPVQEDEVNRALMTKPFSSPIEAADWLKHELRLTSQNLQKVIDAIWATQEQEAFPADGAQAVLRRLAAAGIRLALLSNIWYPYMTSVRRYFGEIFDELIPSELQMLSYETGIMKPDPTIFLRLLKAASTPANDAVMVGDSYDGDIKPALTIGMRTMWVLQRPDREVDSLTRVLNGLEPAPTQTVAQVGDIVPELVNP